MKTNGAVHKTAAGWRIEAAGARLPNRFLERLDLRELSEQSTRTYAYDMLAVLRWLRRRRKPLCAFKIEEFLEFVRDQRRALRAPTINRRLRLLHRYLAFLFPGKFQTARGRGRFGRRLDLPYVKEPRLVKAPLSDTQVLTFWKALRSHRDRAITALLWADGLRIGEVLRLRLEDLMWTDMALRVHGKGRCERTVPLAKPVALLLDRYLSVERPTTPVPEVFVVLKGSRRGKPMTYAGVRRLFRYYRQQLQLPQAHPHRFRHTFAVNMIRHGVSVPVLMRLLGHAWPDTSMRYVHFDDKEVREHYERALEKLRAGPSKDDGPSGGLL